MTIFGFGKSLNGLELALLIKSMVTAVSKAAGVYEDEVIVWLVMKMSPVVWRLWEKGPFYRVLFEVSFWNPFYPVLLKVSLGNPFYPVLFEISFGNPFYPVHFTVSLGKSSILYSAFKVYFRKKSILSTAF